MSIRSTCLSALADSLSANGRTALLCAATSGNLEITKLLLFSDVKIDTEETDHPDSSPKLYDCFDMI